MPPFSLSYDEIQTQADYAEEVDTQKNLPHDLPLHKWNCVVSHYLACEHLSQWDWLSSFIPPIPFF